MKIDDEVFDFYLITKKSIPDFKCLKKCFPN